jgi:hypothetical protein
VKPFTGRLSRDGKVFADHVSGEIYQVRSDTTLEFRGTIRFPTAARVLLYQGSPVLLECADGFAIMIDFEEAASSGESAPMTSTFVSNGPPIRSGAS